VLDFDLFVFECVFVFRTVWRNGLFHLVFPFDV
jgi:hypothetical protein